MAAYDAIIIGSGVSGMSAGVILAKHGYRTLILEQHSAPGGLMRTFHRGDCLYSAGIHSLGALSPGQTLWNYFQYLGLLEHIHPVAADPECFASLRFPDLEFDIPYGYDAFASKLTKQFPAEEAAIVRFFEDMKLCASQFPLYNLHEEAKTISPRFQITSLKEYLQDLTDNEELYLILTGLNPYYCIAPHECPLYVHFLTLDSFLKSAWRLDESETTLADAFVKRFVELGGEIQNNSPVREILTENDKVKGVRLAQGQEIAGRNVIFTGHPKQLLHLCGNKQFRPAYRQRLMNNEDTVGVFGVGLEWNRNDCVLATRDMFIYLTRDTARHYAETLLDNGKPPFLYCSASPYAHHGAYSVMTLCVMPYDELSQWHDTSLHHRPKSYEAMKDRLAKNILSVIHAVWPDSKDAIRVKTTFTPLTFRDYTFSPTGSTYGLKKTVGNLKSSQLSVLTKAQGLYLGGQSLVMSGILGSLISSVDCCGAILGRTRFIREIRDYVY